MRTIVSILLSICFIHAFSQNERENREEFTLKLHTGATQDYEKVVESSPYIIASDILQMFPGEKLFIEVEIKKKEIVLLKVVKENLNPEKTMIIEFSQKEGDGNDEIMMLEIFNPFKKDLIYEMGIEAYGTEDIIVRTVKPVPGNSTSIETWPEATIDIILHRWELK